MSQSFSVEELKSQVKDLNLKILQIQEECSHPQLSTTKTAKSNTGNWCSADDYYWYEFHCKLCDKKWTEEQ